MALLSSYAWQHVSFFGSRVLFEQALIVYDSNSLPKMIVPLTFLACWATAVTCISQLVHSLEIESVLLTVTGFVVGLALSFRSSTAYERYMEGRKYWYVFSWIYYS